MFTADWKHAMIDENELRTSSQVADSVYVNP
jgi:hypothetical protein